MEMGSTRPLPAIIADLKRENKSHVELCYYLSEFVTRRPLVTHVTRLNRQSKMFKFKKEYGPQSDTSIFSDLINSAENPGTLGFQLIDLFEQDYGDIREVFIFMVLQRGEHRIGYVSKLIQSMSLRCDRPDWLEDPRTLFDGSFLAALKKLKDEGVPLPEVGGRTNTVLKLYDWCFSDEFKSATGFDEVMESNYDVCYDLGGGFTTPYLSKKFKKNLICLDIFDPRKFEQDSLYLKKIYKKSEMDYDPNTIPFQYFDVFKDRYPLDAQKYLIVTFGFLSSTIANLSEEAEGPRVFSTTYAAVEGLAELILAGKELTLCSYSRPSYAKFLSRCFMVKFENKVLAKAKCMTQDCHRDIGLGRNSPERIHKFLRPVSF